MTLNQILADFKECNQLTPDGYRQVRRTLKGLIHRKAAAWDLNAEDIECTISECFDKFCSSKLRSLRKIVRNKLYDNFFNNDKFKHSQQAYSFEVITSENHDEDYRGPAIDELAALHDWRHPGRLFDEQELRDAAVEALDGLPAREREIMKMIYLEEMPQRKVARLFGVSDSRVHAIRERALCKLRDMMLKRGYHGCERTT